MTITTLLCCRPPLLFVCMFEKMTMSNTVVLRDYVVGHVVAKKMTMMPSSFFFPSFFLLRKK